MEYESLAGSSDESLEDRELATLILCGTIGYEEHLTMGMVKILSKKINMTEKEFIEFSKWEFIPHCEHVKEWLNGLK